MMDRTDSTRRYSKLVPMTVIAVLALAGLFTVGASPPPQTTGTTAVLGQISSETVAASGSTTLYSGDLSRHNTLRFLLAITGSGTSEVRIDWQLPDGTSIQAAVETVTLSSDYAEVPIRAPNATITVAETGGTNSITITGSVVATTQ